MQLLPKLVFNHFRDKKETKKMAYALVTIGLSVTIILALSGFKFFLKDNQTNTNQDNQINVKITNFSINKQWLYLGGLTFDCKFNLTIENKGASNLTGLELKVKLFNNDSEIQVGNYFVCSSENGTIIESLQVGEVRPCDGTILCNVGDEAYRTNLSSNETTIVAQVILNNTFLDEKKSQ
jgi:hypothetical protein